MERINSKQNQTIKEIKKLHTHKGRQKSGEYLIESWHLVQEAINYLNLNQVVTILATEDQYLAHGDDLSGENIIVISDEIAAELSDTSTTQGIFAVCKIEEQSFNVQKDSGAWLLLDNVQDPGNIGTMVRTADAAGFAGVIFGDGTSSEYNGKVLRAMQGSQFHLPVIRMNLKKAMEIFKAQHVKIYGTELNPDAINYQDVQPMDNFALIMGNEGNGMNKDLLKMTNDNLYIPIKGNAESLNVAIAAAVIMFRIKS
ncbi:TrmH family RNA methyltransferase [Fructilactobacillus fructivorans]|uniref:RNA methyltransferase n=1 Tax=Fructilactobacillus fructivorans TaxID=1614 RepID=A0A0C1PQF0_9LACO|nr:RNA methyltransferase [Fructilactobacillus fructivorans]KID42121.1 rRNA methylase [Fructilactobacillus fructivorans]KRK58562.1 rRNA methylase [Fructilactobacillus fructivorans]KRN13407.1 rRNA methylase [Fructilactobacillus fructivorans]MCT0152013.1 RNA methyltransferase [Fructilactobacillus fructivorans]MCT2867905.1 RNA methyltransferase [Fructilactobacillus fructivorans]